MNPIERSEVLPFGEYERIRERFRNRVIEQKKRRRVFIGPHMSATFENRDTVLLQIQEMLRTERISNEQGILHEIETYNELVPAEGQLSLTLFVEIADEEERERALQALYGLHEHVHLQVGSETFQASGEREGTDGKRTTAVHYLRFELSAEAAAAVSKRNTEVALYIDHPEYLHRAEFGEVLIEQLAGDLTWSS